MFSWRTWPVSSLAHATSVNIAPIRFGVPVHTFVVGSGPNASDMKPDGVSRSKTETCSRRVGNRQSEKSPTVEVSQY